MFRRAGRRSDRDGGGMARTDVTELRTRLALRRRSFMALVTGAAAAAAGSRAQAQGAPRRGGVLRVSGNTNPSSMDPQTGGSGSDHVFLYPIFDTLIDFEPATLKAIPGLAES